MVNDPFRPIRLRWDGLGEAGAGAGRQRSPDLEASPTPGTPRFLGRVRNAGAIPTATGRVFLVAPTEVAGPESEGGGSTIVVDSSRAIPVVVVGSHVPTAGEYLICFAVGGRWVAETGTPSTHIACDDCQTPRTNLFLSWSNSLTGPGFTTLIYDGIDTWTSDCVNQLLFRLTCRDGAARFQGSYFSDGPCPTGQTLTCGSPGLAPLGMTQTQSGCSPFLRRYTVSTASCPALASQGYTLFTITQ